MLCGELLVGLMQGRRSAALGRLQLSKQGVHSCHDMGGYLKSFQKGYTLWPCHVVSLVWGNRGGRVELPWRLAQQDSISYLTQGSAVSSSRPGPSTCGQEVSGGHGLPIFDCAL